MPKEPSKDNLAELVDFINSGGLSRHKIFTQEDEKENQQHPSGAAEKVTEPIQTPEMGRDSENIRTNNSAGTKLSKTAQSKILDTLTPRQQESPAYHDNNPVSPTDKQSCRTTSEQTSNSTSQVCDESRNPTEEIKGAANVGGVRRDAQESVDGSREGENPCPLPTRAEGFDIKDPVELLFLLDDNIASGRVVLHKWQIQFMLDFARDQWTQEYPFQAIVRACNGSGKDKYIVSSCVVWLCMRFLQARGVVTSSSGIQLDNQTDTYITLLCNAANRKICEGIWKCNYRYYECLPTGSPITLFATDEAGKAEGYHPLVFGAKMALFESEAKTVPDEIHNAMSRCTGYTHRCLVSTPGLPMGHMYDLDSTAVDRKTISEWSSLTASDYIRYHITAYDCSHIPRSDIERGKRNLPGGETGAAFKSQYLAEYGTTDEMVVIPYTYVWRAYNSVSKEGWKQESFNKAGLDLSDGGDETVLVVRNGNKLLKILPFRFDNTEDTISYLNEKFREYELTSPESLIFADAGGLGKPILDRLKRQGWSNIRYFDNRARPSEPRTYKNRGAESWFHIRKLLERHELILLNDPLLIRQLATRYYKITDGRTHQLLSKLESRAKGYPSPDRADALVLAFCDYKSTFTESVSEELKPFKQPPQPKPTSDFTFREYVSRGVNNYYDRNPSAGKDFSLLREDIEHYNRQRRMLLEQK